MLWLRCCSLGWLPTMPFYKMLGCLSTLPSHKQIVNQWTRRPWSTVLLLLLRETVEIARFVLLTSWSFSTFLQEKNCGLQRGNQGIQNRCRAAVGDAGHVVTCTHIIGKGIHFLIKRIKMLAKYHKFLPTIQLSSLTTCCMWGSPALNRLTHIMHWGFCVGRILFGA